MFRKIIALALTLSFVMGGTSLAVWHTCDHEGCNYGTLSSSHLKRHKLTHTGERKFKCDYVGCNYSAIQSSDLKKHKPTHTEERKLKCDYVGCNYSSIQSDKLKRHVKSKHPEDKPTTGTNDAQLDWIVQCIGKRPRPAAIEVDNGVPPSKMSRILTDGAESTDDESPDKTSINFLLNPE